MSVPSVESSESVLRSRAPFTKLVDKPYSFDSRVTGGDTVDMELPSGSHIQSDVESQIDRDRGARGRRTYRRSASRSR
jgi:hypothetical protein